MHCTPFKIAIVAVNVAIFATAIVLNGLIISKMTPLGNSLGVYLSLIEGAPQDLRQLPIVTYLLIVVAIALKPCAILGCRTAHAVNRCRLLTSSSLVLIFLIAQLSAGIVLLVYETKVKGYFEETAVQMTASIEKDYGTNDGVTAFWTYTMAQWSCCGYNNYTDLTGSPFFVNSKVYPPQCCKNNVICTATLAHTDDVQGCVVPLVNHTKNVAYTVGTVALVTCLLEITAIIIYMLYYKKVIKKEEESRPATISLSESPGFGLPASRL